ncbi:60s ribosomal protein l31 [Lentinula edodes]|uniref:60s ribosomal protein l31 n=1 Tax=Lentinula edodes TaxID=5353 RepID=A0A1Q3E3W4_LENED|nr:60s ribosomal protein l31 [Lentinula edodes]
MFGPFRASHVNSGGLLWKIPWKLSTTRKANARHRLKKVDAVIEAVRASGVQKGRLNFQRSTRCLLATNTLFSVPMLVDTVKGYTRFQNGLELHKEPIRKVSDTFTFGLSHIVNSTT